MRKQDYAYLAELIAIELQVIENSIHAENTKRALRGTVRFLALNFAKKASVNEGAFLAACGINEERLQSARRAIERADRTLRYLGSIPK